MVAGTRVVAMRMKRRHWKALFFLKFHLGGFPGGLVVKNPPAKVEDRSSLIREDLTGHGENRPMHLTSEPML